MISNIEDSPTSIIAVASLGSNRREHSSRRDELASQVADLNRRIGLARAELRIAWRIGTEEQIGKITAHYLSLLRSLETLKLEEEKAVCAVTMAETALAAIGHKPGEEP